AGSEEAAGEAVRQLRVLQRRPGEGLAVRRVRQAGPAVGGRREAAQGTPARRPEEAEPDAGPAPRRQGPGAVHRRRLHRPHAGRVLRRRPEERGRRLQPEGAAVQEVMPLFRKPLAPVLGGEGYGVRGSAPAREPDPPTPTPPPRGPG